MTIQIALAQFKPVRQNVDSNIHTIEHLLAGIKADLIVLPELANSGYLYETSDKLKHYSEPKNGTGKFLSALIAMAQESQGVIVTGYAESDNQHIYNSAAAISQEGVIANYRKAHLYADEKVLFQPGNSGFKIIEWMGVKIGMLICFDWIFPEAARTLALGGAQIIAHPANLVLPYCQNAMVTRSIENKVFTITANRIGQEKLVGKKLVFTGVSQMTSPCGAILYRAPENKATVHVMSIDPELALDKALSTQNDLFDDRRPDLYQL